MFKARFGAVHARLKLVSVCAEKRLRAGVSPADVTDLLSRQRAARAYSGSREYVRTRFATATFATFAERYFVGTRAPSRIS
jgi:hypothetical protein